MGSWRLNPLQRQCQGRSRGPGGATPGFPGREGTPNPRQPQTLHLPSAGVTPDPSPLQSRAHLPAPQSHKLPPQPGSGGGVTHSLPLPGEGTGFGLLATQTPQPDSKPPLPALATRPVRPAAWSWTMGTAGGEVDGNGSSKPQLPTLAGPGQSWGAAGDATPSPAAARGALSPARPPQAPGPATAGAAGTGPGVPPPGW